MGEIAYSGRDNLDVMTEAKRYNSFLIKLVTDAMPNQGKILDFGAGVGTFDDPIRATGRDVECLEVDPTMIAVLKEHGYKVWPDISQVPADYCTGIYTLNVLEHVEDDTIAFRSLFEKLLPGGRLLVYIPAFPILYSSMDKKVGHFRRYRKTPTIRQLRALGYTIHQARYVDTLGFLAAIAYKALGQKDGGLNRSTLRFFDRWLFPLNTILDPIFSWWFGKNLLIVAEKPINS